MWKPMSPEEFRQWYERLKLVKPDLTHEKLAKLLEVDQPRIGKWMRGEVKTSGYLWRALEHLEAQLQQERKPRRNRPRPAAGRPGPEGEG
jgi:hypothetical protein